MMLHHSRRRFSWLLALVLGALILALWLNRDFGATFQVEIQDDASVQVASAEGRQVQPPEIHERQLLRPDLGVIRISVSLDGSPADGASVALVQDVRVVSDPAHIKVLGSSVKGRLEVAAQTLDGWAYVAASLQGCYGYATLSEGCDMISVNLRSYPKIMVRVIDTAGNAVAGCRVLASSGAILDETLHDRVAIFPGPASNRLYSGTTGIDGKWAVAVGGLSPVIAKYRVEVIDERYHVVSGARGEFVLPGGEQLVTVAPIMAAVVKIEGDEVIAELYARPMSPVIEGDTVPRLSAMRAILKKKFKGSIVVLGVSIRPGRAPVCLLSLCGRTSGWTNRKITMKPVAKVTEPERLVLPQAARDYTIPIEIRVLDSSGVAVPGVYMSLSAGDTSSVLAKSFMCKSGVVRRIPPAQYRVLCWDALLRSQFENRNIACNVDTEKIEIRLLQQWRKVKIVPLDALDLPAVYRTVVTCSTSVGERRVNTGGHNRSVWLPVGNVTLTFYSLQGKKRSKEVDIAWEPYAKPAQRVGICVE